MTKEDIQTEAVNLFKENCSLLLEWPTGCGKGLGIMNCILSSSGRQKWLVVVPEIVQIDNWWKDAEKHGVDEKLKPFIEDVICYASLKNYEGSALSIALNEVQHLSEERARILGTILYEQLLMDTATLPKEVKERIPRNYKYKITMKEAVEWGIIPTPEINVHYIELDDWQKIHYKKTKTSIFPVTAKSYYSYLTSNFKYWQKRAEEDEVPWIQKRMFMAAITRKRWIAEYKTEKAKEILALIKGKRSVIFCGSVAQAKALGGKQAVHSGNKRSQELIDAFNALEIDELYACSMMKEGMNLEQIEAGLVIQLDGKDLGNIQRLGRILRSEFPEFHTICVKGTKDEDYLKDFLKAIKI